MNRTNINENKGYQKALEKINAEGIASSLNEGQVTEFIIKQKLHHL